MDNRFHTGWDEPESIMEDMQQAGITTAVLELGCKIVHAHIRDCSLDRSQGRTPLETQIAGRGILDWPSIIRNLKKVGYKKALDTQIIGAFTSPLSFQMGMAAEARGYINRCLQELN
jgi:sugar phosphate isomerase/epimerase